MLQNMDMNTYQTGNSVRLQCIFKDFNGANVDPAIVQVTIYNYRYTILDRLILGAENRIDIGTYEYFFLTESEDEMMYVYEFRGETNGIVSLKRASFRTYMI